MKTNKRLLIIKSISLILIILFISILSFSRRRTGSSFGGSSFSRRSSSRSRRSYSSRRSSSSYSSRRSYRSYGGSRGSSRRRSYSASRRRRTYSSYRRRRSYSSYRYRYRPYKWRSRSGYNRRYRKRYYRRSYKYRESKVSKIRISRSRPPRKSHRYGYSKMISFLIIAGAGALVFAIGLFRSYGGRRVLYTVTLVGFIVFGFFGFFNYTFNKNYFGVLIEHDNYITDLAFSPNGKYVASASADGTVKVWDYKNLSLVFSTPRNIFRYSSVAFSPDGKYLACGNVKIDVYDIQRKRLHFTLYGSKKDNEKIDRLEKKIKDNYQKYKRTYRSFVVPEHFQSIVFTPDGKFIISNSLKKLKMWELETGELVKTVDLKKHNINYLKFLSEKNVLLVGTRLNLFRVKYPDLKIVGGDIPKRYYKTRIKSQDITGNGNFMISSGFYRTISLYKLKYKRKKMRLIGHTHSIKVAKFSPDDKFIVSGGYDNKIIVWRMADLLR